MNDASTAPAPRVDIRSTTIWFLLIAINVAVWIWALLSFRHSHLLLGTALLAYGFGLRHAVDADHIAAIDNVTRKLMQDGKDPSTVGLFFSLGHSTIVVLTSLAIALAAITFKAQLDSLHAWGGTIGVLVSSVFLLIIALTNIFTFSTVYGAFRKVKSGKRYVEQDLDALARGSVLARLLRPLFNIIRRSWHMYPLGMLFGLGFDTATEIGVLGISAAEAAKGVSLWSILIFPALFTAGMSLVDTADSMLMMRAYGWAFIKPLRKLYYNMVITGVSAVIALFVGGIEALGLIGEYLKLNGGFWQAIVNLNSQMGLMGYFIIGFFALSWLVSMLIYRAKRYDEVGMHIDGSIDMRKTQ